MGASQEQSFLADVLRTLVRSLFVINTSRQKADILRLLACDKVDAVELSFLEDIMDHYALKLLQEVDLYSEPITRLKQKFPRACILYLFTVASAQPLFRAPAHSRTAEKRSHLCAAPNGWSADLPETTRGRDRVSSVTGD